MMILVNSMPTRPPVAELANISSALPPSLLKDDAGKHIQGKMLTVQEAEGWKRVSAWMEEGGRATVAGGRTSATGSFSWTTKQDLVVNIPPRNTIQVQVVQSLPHLHTIAPYEIYLCEERGDVKEIAFGVGVTFGQIQKALAPYGRQVMVDLTSIQSAAAGGVLATGAVGRRGVAPTITGLAMIDEKGSWQEIEGSSANKHIGMEGRTGLVTAATMHTENILAADAFAFVVPVGRDLLADIAKELSAYRETHNGVRIHGIEVVDSVALTAAKDSPEKTECLKAMEKAGTDMILIIDGQQEEYGSFHELFELPSIAQTIEHGFDATERITNIEAMRESAPEALRGLARTETAESLSTDVNVDISTATREDIAAVLKCYEDYEKAVHKLQDACQNRATITIGRYGHANNRIDIHHRVVVETKDVHLRKNLLQLVKTMREKLTYAIVEEVQAREHVHILRPEKGASGLVALRNAGATLSEELQWQLHKVLLTDENRRVHNNQPLLAAV